VDATGLYGSSFICPALVGGDILNECFGSTDAQREESTSYGSIQMLVSCSLEPMVKALDKK